MDRVLRSAILNSNVIDVIQDNKRPFDELMSKYRCAIMEIETKFKVLNEQFSLQYDRNPIETIKTRLKSMESISRKLAQKGKSFSAKSMEENLDDIAGIRIICSFQEDIYKLAKCLLDQDDIELLETKDYIKNPKQSGYRSLHLIVRVPIFLQNEKCLMKVEVQLRTIAMDFWASLEHKLRYKKEIPEFEKDSLQKELFETYKEKITVKLTPVNSQTRWSFVFGAPFWHHRLYFSLFYPPIKSKCSIASTCQ